MIIEDWEREAQKDLVYLLEHTEMLKQELREEAIIYYLENKTTQDANQQVANIRIITPEGIQSRSDIPVEPNK